MSAPTVPPTGWRQMLMAALVGVTVAVLAEAIFDRTLGGVPAPYGTALGVAALALAVWLLARQASRRMAGCGPRIAPDQAVGWLGLAKASMIGGAFTVGLFGWWCVVSLPRWVAPLARERVIHGGLGVVAAMGWAWAGARLQAALRLPPSDDALNATPQGPPEIPSQHLN